MVLLFRYRAVKGVSTPSVCLFRCSGNTKQASCDTRATLSARCRTGMLVIPQRPGHPPPFPPDAFHFFAQRCCFALCSGLRTTVSFLSAVWTMVCTGNRAGRRSSSTKRSHRLSMWCTGRSRTRQTREKERLPSSS